MDNKKYAKEMMVHTLKGMEAAREINNMKDYKTLSNSLKELYYVLSQQTNREGFKVTDIKGTEIIIDLLDKEIETLSKISKSYLRNNKIVEYHDSVVSFGKIEMVKNKLKMLIEDFHRQLRQRQEIEEMTKNNVYRNTVEKDESIK